MANILYFDFVDPISYVQEIELDALGSDVERVGFELAPPPEALRSVHDERWARRYEQARAFAPTVTLAPPTLVPWTRKAHELHLHAVETGRRDEVRRAIFEAYFGRGDDIGRVDRLVSLAVSLGMDRTEVKAALDVDRHQEGVSEARRAAVEAGVVDTPTLVISGKSLRGFHNRHTLGTLIGRA
jgi:predicted DsbA family dithiol-disulfide isomerase